MIQIVSSFFGDLKNEWQSLYNSEKHTVFQSYEYNKNAWLLTCKGKELYILVYKDSQNVIQGILPSCLVKKQLRFINDHGTDFCDCIISPNIKYIDFVQELCEYINNDPKITSVVFENLMPTSNLLSHLKVIERRSFVYSLNEYSYVSCSSGLEPFDNCSNLNNEKKKKLRKIVEKSKNFTFHVYRDDDLLPLEDLEELFLIMVNKGWRSSSEFQSNFWDFVKSCYDSNILEIALLRNEDEPVSAGMVFYNDSMSVRWVILYSEAKYNLWNNVNYINHKAKELKRSYEINFGRGGYDYKINNFKPNLANLYSVSYSKTFFGSVILLFTSMIYGLKRVLKTYLKK